MTKKVSCNPPLDCFNCKYKDCIAPNGHITQKEVQYISMFLNKKLGSKKPRKVNRHEKRHND